MMRKYIVAAFLSQVLFLSGIYAQQWNPARGCIVDPNTDECLINAVLTAVPYLRITPDARTGGMGNTGVALSPDPNMIHYNASSLAFYPSNFGFAFTYTPWLRALGINDIYLLYLSGVYKVDKLSMVGAAVRFFNLGEIEFVDENGQSIGLGNPREFDISLSYARKLSDKFSASLSTRYIYSNLANGQIVNGNPVKIGHSVAIDLGMTYKTDIPIGGRNHNFTVGMAATNIGSKISYIRGTADFIPSNLALGVALDYNLDAYNILTITIDLNKYLVPTPQRDINDPDYDKDQNGIPDFREKPLFSGIFGSFADAPGGASEELQEVMLSTGLEYWYNGIFAVRLGYFYEHPLKGGRQFLTWGLGVRYSDYNLNFSYLVPTGLYHSPLANTLRFGFVYNTPNTTDGKKSGQ